ncbi:hypothetical protein [Pseudoalteromonas viridis]|uniref:Uncharacterized protein n=1 Tax=Pseudoalteromonas viridis TaxID=339617 RepID=A0ABX7V113_9GAMM|nr:hypothetical protein [Pseudoalteromonas viridis]QTL34558.1 hypothetical protein J5X90_13530 [Pseudoalteromonas viridis]
MAKRTTKILTPVAASIALSLGLSGCSLFDDDDNNVPVNPTNPSVEGSVNANFSVSISGKAVKGTLSGAMVSVKTVDAQGNKVDLAYRTQAGEESATETAETEEAAKAKASAKLISANPAELKTTTNGFYEIFVDENFSGPVYITVTTTKEGDALVKCDAFAGCGAGSAVKVDDGSVYKENGKIDFGEWYKDDLELSVVKLITPASSDSATTAKRGPSFADGDDGFYRANLSVFTSTAARILLGAGTEIDAASVGAASTQVIQQLVGDVSLVAALANDLSLGGAIDFTSVDGSEKLDAGALVLIQVASSLQSLAGKDGRPLGEVLTELSADVETGNLANSQTFTRLKDEAKKAGNVLRAVVSGDQAAIKAALVEAGVSEEDIDAVAADIESAVDTAVNNGATSEDDLKDDIDTVVDQLDDIGNGDASSDKQSEAILASVASSQTALAGSDTTLAGFATSLETVKGLGADLSTKEKAIEYSAAATVLSTQYTAAINLDADGDNLGKLLAREFATAEQLVSAATQLVTQNAKYQPTLDQANALLTQVTALIAQRDQLSTDIAAELAAAKAKIDEYGAALDAAKKASDDSLVVANTDKQVADEKKAAFETQQLVAENAVKAITDQDSAVLALAELNKAQAALAEALTAYNNAETSANTALTLANAYKAEAQNQGESTDSADLAIAQANILIDGAKAALISLDASRTKLSIYSNTALGKQGSDKLVNISFVTKEGADAIFNAGEILYDVVRDIWDSGLDTGKHSGTAPNFPNWAYSYDTDDFELKLKNTQGDEQIDAVYQITSAGSTSRVVLTWSGLLTADSGQKIEIQKADLGACDAWAVSNNGIPNASCSVLYVEGSISKIEDVESVTHAKTFNVVEFVDGQYGFKGSFSSDATAVDAQGNPVALFTDGAIELADVTLSGRSEDTDFTAHFDLRNESGSNDLGLANIMLDNFNGYAFKVSLIDESGPLLGNVSLNNDTNIPAIVGNVEEITNGFRIDYINGESIEYTDIDFLGQSNN